ncbi:MAG: hypothetical protein R3181_13555 [Rubricoccaceae bacterium]|nr:hypothetical protein [Rubricoccaceae bacterium]
MHIPPLQPYETPGRAPDCWQLQFETVPPGLAVYIRVYIARFLS